MEGRQRRSFTDDYKRQAVDLVASSGRSIGSAAKQRHCLIFGLDLYEIFQTRGHHSGGLSPGDDSHSLTCEAVSSCRALRDKSSRSRPCGRDLICSLTRSASCAKRWSNEGLGGVGWMRDMMALLIFRRERNTLCHRW
jgi:hypothetical protein